MAPRFQRHQTEIARHLLAAVKALGLANDQHERPVRSRHRLRDASSVAAPLFIKELCEPAPSPAPLGLWRDTIDFVCSAERRCSRPGVQS
jgi:hypothetical protein